MRNWWIKFGCFLTGYNYRIVSASSEMAAKAVKRYTAAMLIVCILWAFVGYTFTRRYLNGTTLSSIFGALIAVIIIVQIERQIILTMRRNRALYWFRGLLALLMALIGAVIIDQIILKQDIELEKIAYVENRVDSLLPSKTRVLKEQIFALDTTIQAKEQEREAYIADVARTPLIKNVTTQTQSIPVTTTKRDSLGVLSSSVVLKPSTNVMVTNSANPKQALIAPLDKQIADLRIEKNSKDNMLLNIRPTLEKEVNSKIGFLDELKVMYQLISHSWVAFGFWLLWLLFLLFIEMLVLTSKLGDRESDYDKTVLHHMNLQIKRLDVMEKAAGRN